MLLAIRLQCIGFWIQLDYLMYTSVVGLCALNSDLRRILLAADLPER